jgi:hypothetical protein
MELKGDTMRIEEPLPPCARCGATIEEHDSDVLLIFSNDERDAEITGDLGELLEAYCERCMHDIEEAHKHHDEEVEAMRRALDALPTYRKGRSGRSGD